MQVFCKCKSSEVVKVCETTEAPETLRQLMFNTLVEQRTHESIVHGCSDTPPYKGYTYADEW